MKKITALLLAVMFVLSLAACGEKTIPNSVFSVDDLPGKSIGVQLGTTGDTLASDYEDEGSTVKKFNKGADAVLALKQGQIDCVIIDNEPAKYFVSENKDLKILEDPFAVEDYAIAVAKDNQDLTKEINGALAELKADGTLDSIVANYVGEEKGQHPYESPADADRSKGVLTMATNAEFPPYEYYDNGKIVGFDIDMAQAICDRLGYELKVVDMAFDAVVIAVQTGQCDIGVAGLSVTEERLEEVDFTESYATSNQVIIVRAAE